MIYVLKYFAENFVARDFENVLVDPEKPNKIAIKCYKNAGFKIVKETEEITLLLKSLK